MLTSAADDILRATYEAPFTVMCGAELAALGAGFAIYLCGTLYLTPAGARYLLTQGDTTS